MKESLAAGLTYETTFAVSADMSPPHLEGVLSTPRMIGLIEDVCLDALEPYLNEGETTVGTRVNVSHVDTAYAGDRVTVRVRLTKVTGRRLLTFDVEVVAPGGVIGKGIHQRLQVDKSSLRAGDRTR